MDNYVLQREENRRPDISLERKNCFPPLPIVGIFLWPDQTVVPQKHLSPFLLSLSFKGSVLRAFSLWLSHGQNDGLILSLSLSLSTELIYKPIRGYAYFLRDDYVKVRSSWLSYVLSSGHDCHCRNCHPHSIHIEEVSHPMRLSPSSQIKAPALQQVLVTC